MNRKPLAQDEYEILAEAYAAHIDTKPHNAFLDRPAVLSLLPQVLGRDVLDAGCGPGAYAEELLRRGARVVALDASPAMLTLAQARISERIGPLAAVEWKQANLEEPLELEDERFDVAIAPLVFDYIEDWVPTLRELGRVLRPGGALIFSCTHPCSDLKQGYLRATYFEKHLLRMRWRGFAPTTVEMPSFHRPLSEVFNSIRQSGLELDFVLEPRPTPDFRRADPESYEELMQQPGFLALRALKKQAL